MGDHPLLELAGLIGSFLIRMWFPLTLWGLTIVGIRFLWVRAGYLRSDERGRLPIPRRVIDETPAEALETILNSQTVDLLAASHPPPPHTVRTDTRFTISSLRHPQLPQVVSDTTPSLVPHTDWWPKVLAHHSHMDLIGQNTSGKTTLATAVLTERAKTDKVVILDLHAKFNQWAGLPAIGAGRDINAIAQAFAGLHAEFERRFRVGEAVGEPLTIFIDEYPALALLLPTIVPLVKQWLREAPKAGIRLVMLAQEPNAKTFGFDGEAAIRKNMLHVLLGEYAAEVSEIAAAQQYPAVLKKHGKTFPLDVSQLPDLAGRPVPPDVLWLFPERGIQSGTGGTVGTPNGAWTDEHMQVAYWLGLDPTLSAREIARRLWPQKDSGGRAAQRAKHMMDAVRSVPVPQIDGTPGPEERWNTEQAPHGAAAMPVE